MFTISEFKAVFNADAILKPAEKFRLKMFKEFGAYTRSVAKNSMIDVNAKGDEKRQARLNKKIARAGFIKVGNQQVSQPGNAAFSRVGYLKQFIYFAADKDDVVIGPALLNGVKSKGAVEALEFGGTEQVAITRWVKGQPTKTNVTAQYKARPTMRLAFAKAVEKKLPKLIESGIMREA